MRLLAGVVIAAFALMLLFERLRPLRREREPKLRRVTRNVTTGAIALVIAWPLQLAILLPVSQWVMSRNVGLLHVGRVLNPALRTVLAILLLDYTLWFWHWANHRVPLLWRFHLVHHVDRDLDASTALRFHFGEQALSVLYRAAQIVIIGAEAPAVWIWQVVLFVAIFFHHANFALPRRADAWLVRLVVTPRMHGIHHAQRREWTNSNWSSILTCWDWLHGTMCLGVPDEAIVIGVPAYDDPAEVTVGRIQWLPFRRRRDDWACEKSSASSSESASSPR